MKKLMKLFLIFLFSVNVFAHEIVTTAEDDDLTSEKPHLWFVTEDLAPFNYVENGVVVGFFPDMMFAICTEIEVTCDVTMLTWLDAEWQVRRGEADGLFAIARGGDRDGWLMFSPPIVQSRYSFFIEDEEARFFDAFGMTGAPGAPYKVGAYGPSNLFNTLLQKQNQQPELEAVRYNSTFDAINALQADQVQAIFGNVDSIETTLAMHELAPLHDTGEDQMVRYHYAFSNENVDIELVEKFNAGYKTLKDNGRLQTIADYYSVTLVD